MFEDGLGPVAHSILGIYISLPAKEMEAGERQWAEPCLECGAVALIPYSEVLPNLTDTDIKPLPIAQYSNIKTPGCFNTSVLMPTAFYVSSPAKTPTYISPCSVFLSTYSRYRRASSFPVGNQLHLFTKMGPRVMSR